MRILLAVDSRVANVGGIALLDLADRGRSEFFCHTCDEDFKRKGLRGFAMNGDMMYVVNSAALYFFKIDTSGNGGPLATHIKTVRRPEWEIGAILFGTGLAGLLCRQSILNPRSFDSKDLRFVVVLASPARANVADSRGRCRQCNRPENVPATQPCNCIHNNLL